MLQEDLRECFKPLHPEDVGHILDALKDYLREKINEVIIESKEENQFAILFMDLDKFKEANDTLGHDVGDFLIKDVLNILKDYVNEDDIVSRLSGDEFIVLKRIKNNIGEVIQFCNHINQEFSEPWIIQKREVYMTISIGIAIYPRDGIDCMSLLRKADIAMYKAKELGGSQYVFYNSSINRNLVNRFDINSRLKKALKNDEFVLHYQPVIDAVTKKTIGAEALIRWNRPGRGIIMPGEFIKEAEASGLIVPIGEWVLKTALGQLKEWQDKGYKQLFLSINVSVMRFRQFDFLEKLENLIKKTGVFPGSIELEITESVMLENISYTRDILIKLSEMGIKVFLDDFGTGYSSLNYLSNLPIHGFKLDKSFTEEIPSNQRQIAIAKALMILATDLGLTVTVEGIEKQEQLAFFELNNFNRIQGYLYSKPLPNNEFEIWLNKNGIITD